MKTEIYFEKLNRAKAEGRKEALAEVENKINKRIKQTQKLWEETKNIDWFNITQEMRGLGAYVEKLARQGEMRR